MSDITHEREEPLVSEEEARIQRVAKLGDELVRLEKTSVRSRAMRIALPVVGAVVTVVYALEVGDPFIVSILVGALVGILAMHRWWASRLASMRLSTEEEFDSLTRTLPASPSSAGQNPQEPGV